MRGLAKFILFATAACATTQEPAEKPVKPTSVRRAKRQAPKPPPIADNLTSADDLAPAGGDDASAEAEVLGQGVASFYADSLAGNRTASGERYQPDQRTCAHRTLPFGTKLRIVATKSGKTSSCRVNDRGPFVAGRILDVSKRVARELGMIDAGVLEVRIERAGDGEI